MFLHDYLLVCEISTVRTLALRNDMFRYQYFEKQFFNVRFSNLNRMIYYIYDMIILLSIYMLQCLT